MARRTSTLVRRSFALAGELVADRLLARDLDAPASCVPEVAVAEGL